MIYELEAHRSTWLKNSVLAEVLKEKKTLLALSVKLDDKSHLTLRNKSDNKPIAL